MVIVALIYLFDSAASRNLALGAPHLERLADVEGTETEVAIAPDGTRLLAIASGDLWLLDTSSSSNQRLTSTPEPESSPAWAPDGLQVTYTRGTDTFSAQANDPGTSELFKRNATALNWSETGRVTFVRERALWVADSPAGEERELVPAESVPDITIRQPRFSPDSQYVAFLKSTLGLRAEIWLVDANTGDAQLLIGDRLAENPTGIGWMDSGNHIVTLTNRSGVYALWIVDILQNYIEPLTTMLTGVPLEPIGLDVRKDRIVVPRHVVDSDIVLSDGTAVAQTESLEFEPAVSPDGTRVAYTLQKDSQFEIWTVGVDGQNPRFHTLGREPRFSANGFQLIYTHTSVLGEVDLRKVDLRDGSSASVTDAREIDFQADWSPDGRTIAFASGLRNMSLWTAPGSGGKRLGLAGAGYYPRFSPDSRSIFFWDRESFWSIPASGGDAKIIRMGIAEPAPAVWVKNALRYYRDSEIHRGKAIWPLFDVLPDGRIATAPIEVRETALWSVELTYVSE